MKQSDKSRERSIGNIILDENVIHDIVYKAVLTAIARIDNSSNISQVNNQNIERNHSKLEVELESLKSKYNDCLKHYDDLQQLHSSALEEMNYIKNQVNELNKERNKLLNDIETKNKQYSLLTIKHDKLTNNFQSLEIRNQKLDQQYRDSVDTLKQEKKELKTLKNILSETFEVGRNIFNGISKLPKSYQTYLEVEIDVHDFEGFIISSTISPRTLLRIWQAAYDSIVKNNDIKSFEVLWGYFEYARYLYNKGRQEEIIKLSETSVGDIYDPRDVEPDATSAQRGIIKRVYIQGFFNGYNEEQLAKSYVHVE